MKILFLLFTLLLIPFFTLADAQYMGNVGSGGEIEPFTLEEALENQKRQLESTQTIPDWIKNIALWYGQGKISEREFISAISFLIDQNILNVPQLENLKIQNEFLESENTYLREKISELESKVEVPKPTPSPQISLDDDPIRGDPNAPITIVEFSDFQCPFCARFHTQTLPFILEEYIEQGKVNLVYRDFPIQSIHPNALTAAIAAECADEQGRYWEYHDTLFENQDDWNRLDSFAVISTFSQYASDLGMNEQQFDDCLESGKYLVEVQGDLADGRDYDVTGTPAFFVGNEQIGFVKINGAQPFEVFKNIIDSLYKELG